MGQEKEDGIGEAGEGVKERKRGRGRRSGRRGRGVEGEGVEERNMGRGRRRRSGRRRRRSGIKGEE